jgi:hypothetical protein
MHTDFVALKWGKYYFLQALSLSFIFAILPQYQLDEEKKRALAENDYSTFHSRCQWRDNI